MVRFALLPNGLTSDLWILVYPASGGLDSVSPDWHLSSLAPDFHCFPNVLEG